MEELLRQSDSFKLSQKKLNVEDQSIEAEADIYHLHAILVHSGTINSGHYYCFIRPTVDGKWYKFNDRTVSEIE
jgi:ubiquitin carboxyl-terminal hydrolase 7